MKSSWGRTARSIRTGKRLTFQHFLETVPHDVDILYAYELKLDIRVIVFILIALPSCPVCHGIQLQQEKMKWVRTEGAHPVTLQKKEMMWIIFISKVKQLVRPVTSLHI